MGGGKCYLLSIGHLGPRSSSFKIINFIILMLVHVSHLLCISIEYTANRVTLMVI